MRVLKEQADKVGAGDLGHAEAMLCSQATAFNTMFAELARRAAVNMGEYMGATETYLKLALRAQNQCRATLATIKSPPVVFAKQANIAHGPQQVNNNTASIARASETERAPNELLEADHHEQGLDTGATRPAGAGHQELATVETVHRPRTAEGKASASRNAWKGGSRPLFRAMADALRGQWEWLDEGRMTRNFPTPDRMR
ncbi:MAG: hypothetical protein ACTHNM_06085 [Dyella sp.]|uniref:hypothetical protein n=1 Tax=Dyella sp. TaxID=1869338 RepID=UPI003F7D9FE8